MRAVSDDLSIPSPAAYRPPNRARGLSPDTKRRMVIAGGILGAVIVIGGTVALIGRSTGEVPVIQADQRPIRVKPENPGGLQIAGVNNEIYSDGDTRDGARLAPGAEAPNPAALRAPPPETHAPENPRPDLLAAARTAAPTANAPATTAPATTPPPTSTTAAKPVARTAPPAPQTANPQGANSQGVNTQGVNTQGAATNQTAAAPKPAPTAQRVEPTKPAAETPARAQGGRISVQLAAVRSQGAAQAEWVALQRRLPDLLGGRQAVFPKTERDGKTFWRVRTAGFSDVAEARGFCERVRAKGAACAVAEF